MNGLSPSTNVETTCASEAATPGHEIEGRVADVAEVVLDVVAEDPEEQHVPEEVHQAAVHEHGVSSVR